MLMLFIGLLLIVGIISFFYFSYNDGESITLNWMDQTGVFPLAWIPYLIVGFIVLMLAAWLLSQFFSIPRKIRRSGELRGMRKSRDSLDRGLLEIQSGDLEKGEATLTNYTDRTPGDAVKYIAAAKSAHSRGDGSRAEQFLKKASDLSTDAAPAIRVAQAEMMLQRGDHRDAETLLLSLHQANPGNGHIMGMLATALQGTGNTARLSELTRLMRSNTRMPVAKIEPLETEAWTRMVQESDSDKLDKAWESLPGDARNRSDIVEVYARRLINANQSDKAQPILEKALNTDFSEGLVEAYGDLESSNVAKLLKQLEMWRSKEPNSAALLHATGKLNARSNNLNAARDALVKSAQLKLDSDVAKNLGDVLDALGDSENAKDCFKSAAALAKGNSAVGTLLDLKNLAKNLGAQPMKQAG